MPYALFEDDQKLSQEYPTEQGAWQRADDAGLIAGASSVPISRND